MIRLPFRRRLIALVTASLLAAASFGCDARAREARARLTDAEALVFDRGSRLSAPCWACHDFYGTQNKVGPHLSGLMGRRAGDGSFGGYSEGLRQSGIVWDSRSLGRFLANPQQLVPGTTMVSPGIASGSDRAALVFYIEQVTQ